MTKAVLAVACEGEDQNASVLPARAMTVVESEEETAIAEKNIESKKNKKNKK